MTSNATNYTNSTLQGKKTTWCGKIRTKEAQSEAGKSRQGAVSASLDKVNMGEDGIAVTEVSRQQGTEQAATQKQPAALCMDSPSIPTQN